MRKRDPRRVIGRRRQARARVKIVDVPQSDSAPDGSVTTEQAAEVTLPRAELDRIWSPEYLERLARTYWRFLTRVSLGLLRVLYTPDSREIALLGRPFVLLRFYAPEYETEADSGTVTWRIKKGLLVAPAGPRQGLPADHGPPGRRRATRTRTRELITGTVTSEVANFYPLLAGWGWFSRIGRHLYRFTQLQIHVIVTHAFLRSLARLDLAPSVGGSARRAVDAASGGTEAAKAS